VVVDAVVGGDGGIARKREMIGDNALSIGGLHRRIQKIAAAGAVTATFAAVFTNSRRLWTVLDSSDIVLPLDKVRRPG